MSEFTPEDWEVMVSEREARIAELGDALRPFSDASKKMRGAKGSWSLCKGVKVADLRRAHEVLEES